ncbi:MAG: phosphoribosylformylglycinamidine synthase subunit PurL [Bacteroidota bacterium]
MAQTSDQLLQRAHAYLTGDEIYSIGKMLGREPNPFELNMFATMWTEHISYKSSIRWLEELPGQGDRVVVPTGTENAGVIDLGDNIACVVKMESHNHPTAFDPGQGAVGVGNVNRDIIAMGAEPIAQLGILRFGDPALERSRELVNSVIRAIGSYSNNFGVAVVGGEILFDQCYNFNPLVNLMAVGLVKKDRIVKAAFKNSGYAIYLLGRSTSGRGVYGAGFASSGMRKERTEMVPESQLADPYAGKVLMKCILELRNEGLIRGMQDIGSGGVLCAAAEMAFKGGTGVELYTDLVPLMRDDLTPLEIVLSQTQEQMLIGVKASDEKELMKFIAKWGIPAARIGKVTDDKRIRIRHNDSTLGDLPVALLVRGGGAPVYIRELQNPRRKVVKIEADDLPAPGSLKDVARSMIRRPNVASRRWIYEQFDTMAGLSNLTPEHSCDAAVLQSPAYNKIIALSVDGNHRYIRQEPRKGAMIAVAEAARNIICSGGEPVAVADCLNFGDPADPFVYYDFVESVKGISQACEKMKLPVIAGNVSFHNLTREGDEVSSVLPTPVIGMVGVLKDRENIMSMYFRRKGDMIYLIGRSQNDLSGSEYLAAQYLVESSASPDFDLEYEMKLQKVVAGLIREKLIRSAHDVSLGGLFITLVECAIPGSLGFDITSPAEIRTDAFLFGEAQSRVVVSVSPESEAAFLDFMMEQGIHFSTLGHVTKEELRIDDSSFGFISDYARDFENALAHMLEKE